MNNSVARIAAAESNPVAAQQSELVPEEITTVRILRLALFGLGNQEMTVRELRTALFNIEEQDMRIDLLASNLGRVLGIDGR